MTVIAYSSRHRILAGDSKISDSFGAHVTPAQKIFRLPNGALMGGSGDSDFRDVRELLGKASSRKMPSRNQLAELHMEFTGILVFPRGQVFTVEIEHREFANEGEWAGQVNPIQDGIVAVGCGYQYAYGAMDTGASPIEAVRAACKRDSACALPVRWERLEAPKKGAR